MNDEAFGLLLRAARVMPWVDRYPGKLIVTSAPIARDILTFLHQSGHFEIVYQSREVVAGHWIEADVIERDKPR